MPASTTRTIAANTAQPSRGPGWNRRPRRSAANAYRTADPMQASATTTRCVPPLRVGGGRVERAVHELVVSEHEGDADRRAEAAGGDGAQRGPAARGEQHEGRDRHERRGRPSARRREVDRGGERRKRRNREAALHGRPALDGGAQEQRQPQRQERGEPVPVVQGIAEPAGLRGQELGELVGRKDLREEPAPEGEAPDHDDPDRDPVAPAVGVRPGRTEDGNGEHAEEERHPVELVEGVLRARRPGDGQRGEQREGGQEPAGNERRPGNPGHGPHRQPQRERDAPPEDHGDRVPRREPVGAAVEGDPEDRRRDRQRQGVDAEPRQGAPVAERGRCREGHSRSTRIDGRVRQSRSRALVPEP